MRSAVSLALAASLIGAVLPAAAQGQGQPDSPGWRDVRRLAPGTTVIVTARDAQAMTRQIVAVDDANLTVLNAGSPPLPTDASEVLRNVASTHPESLLAAQKGGQFVFEKNVRLGPDGVFVADRKVADLVQIVERYVRDDVIEIATAPTESNPVGCALAGYFGGGIIGGLPGALVGGAVGRDTGPALLGMVVGWSLGAVYVYRKCRHKPEKVIYSAP